ncbi:MAG TPA: endosialidase [Lachnospiraceae bacterium]|nr:endosialidase [Lachnospiraceae bacterium]
MAVVEQLLRSESDGTISFGNHELLEKQKLQDFQNGGDLYKVKTYQSLTKLEKNGMFVYESVPGSSVNNFWEDENGVSFVAEGKEDVQITIGLMDETEYEVFIANESVGKMTTNLGGKLSFGVELAEVGEVSVKILRQ